MKKETAATLLFLAALLAVAIALMDDGKGKGNHAPTPSVSFTAGGWSK